MNKNIKDNTNEFNSEYNPTLDLDNFECEYMADNNLDYKSRIERLNRYIK